MKYLLLFVWLLTISTSGFAAEESISSLRIAKMFNITHEEVEDVVLGLIVEEGNLLKYPGKLLGIQIIEEPAASKAGQTYLISDQRTLLLTAMRLPGYKARKICDKMIELYLKEKP